MSSALTPCKTCKKEVARTAKTCPHCGVSSPGATSAGFIGCLSVFVVLAVLAAVIANTGPGNGSASLDVTAAEFGESWPLTVSSARLYCNRLGERSMAIDGAMYALNGKALSAGMQRPDAVTKSGMTATVLTERAGALCP